ncbi:TRAP transporter small permease subunit [Oceaniglobus indicus]|uniref:TRAP transporter small permease subunit n=1 Tax=Oceaniglobus indicus TaxID=2047749 RepID=UPI000C197AD2|nr:TRAP transporter small permease subunit [Oceaniglobus indicus]
MNTMLGVARVLEQICVWAARLAGVLLLILTAVILYDVIGRRFINTGSVALQELEWHLHGAIAVLAFGYAYTRNAHVRIDILSQKWSEARKLRLEVFGIIVLLTPFLLGVVWFGWDFAMRSFTRGEGAAGLGLSHRWIIKSTVPISAVLALCGAWSVALRAIVVLRAPERLTSPFTRTGLWSF